MGDDVTTTETKLPPPTAQETALQNMAVDNLIPAYMEQQGYSMKQRSETVYDDPKLVESLKEEVADMDKRLKTAKPGSQEYIVLMSQRNEKRNQLKEQLATSHEEIKYDMELTPYGEKLKLQREQSLDYQMELTEKFMKSTNKFLDGDFSIRDDQKALIKQQLQGIRGPVTAMLDEVKSEYEKTGKSMSTALDGYISQINATGLSVGAAMNAIGERIDDTKAGILSGIGEEETKIGATGQNVMAALTGVREEISKTGDATRDALEKSFAIRQTLANKNMEDTYIKQRNEMANRAASLGRSPMDPAFQQEMQTQMMDKISTLNLEMAEQEALMRTGLVERTGMRQEEVGMKEAGVAEAQGQRMEGAAAKKTATAESTGMRKEALTAEEAAFAERQGISLEQAEKQKMAIAERTGAGAEAVAGQKVALEESLQQRGHELETEIGMGIPGKQAGLGMDVGGYQSAIRQQQLANTGAAVQVGAQQQGAMQAERMAQPTTTTTTSNNMFGQVMGTIGGLAGAAGGVMTGVGALKK